MVEEIHPMKRTVVTAGVLGLLGVSSAFAEDAKIAVTSDRISLFEVALRCEAAPEIGCGSRSKPVLLQLEREPMITEAWLNETGTVLAVVGKEGSSRESRSETVQSILKKSRVTAVELQGEAREIQFKSYVSGKDWYRGAEVDNLSKREARTIAARLVHRIEAKVPLAREKASALEIGVANVFERTFIGPSNSDPTNKREQIIEELSAIAHQTLDEREVAAFKEAMARGVRPLPDVGSAP